MSHMYTCTCNTTEMQSYMCTRWTATVLDPACSMHAMIVPEYKSLAQCGPGYLSTSRIEPYCNTVSTRVRFLNTLYNIQPTQYVM